MLLTVELTEPDKIFKEESSIMIFCDNDGLDLLIDNLNKLKQSGSHIHLMTPAWAGDELTEIRIDKNNALINHIKIMLTPENKDASFFLNND